MIRSTGRRERRRVRFGVAEKDDEQYSKHEWRMNRHDENEWQKIQLGYAVMLV